MNSYVSDRLSLQVNGNLLTSAVGFFTSRPSILSATPLLNLSCWSKTVEDSVVFLITPHDRKFLLVSTFYQNRPSLAQIRPSKTLQSVLHKSNSNCRDDRALAASIQDLPAPFEHASFFFNAWFSQEFSDAADVASLLAYCTFTSSLVIIALMIKPWEVSDSPSIYDQTSLWLLSWAGLLLITSCLIERLNH